jgi:hypothetical protein
VVFVVGHVGIPASQGRCSKPYSGEFAIVMWLGMVVFWIVVLPIIQAASSVGAAAAALVVSGGIFTIRVLRYSNQGLIVESILRSVRLPIVILAIC